MSETSVGFNFEESFNIFSEFGLQNVGGHLHVFAFSVVLNSVEEPSRDSVPFGIIDNAGNSIALLFSELTSSEARVDSEDFADEEAISTTDTFYSLKGEGYGSLAVNVCVQDTMDVLEVVLGVFDDERHLMTNIILIFITNNTNILKLTILNQSI